MDYANRPESGAEAAYLRRWCEARGVQLEVRVVTEVTRGVTARDEYEKQSRRIRFEAYAELMARSGARAVFFGHHKGDVQENVISNVMRGGGLLELGGMTPASTVNHVRIWRPMLSLGKEDVYTHAHAYGVPYFKDSTPEWSTRGKLRNQVQPLLEDVYGEGYASHLSVLARESAECTELLEAALLGPLLASLHESPLAVWLDTAPWSHLPLFFWRQALRRVCEGRLGVGLIKDKPLKQLLARIALPAAKRRDGWLSLKKEARALLVGTTLVLFRDVFPGHHEGRVWVADSPAPVGTPVAPPPSAARLGGWQVTLRLVTDALPAPAAVTLQAFLSGKFAVALPEAASYAATATRRREGDKAGHYECATPGLQGLEGAWPGIIAAVPQLTPVDVPMDASPIVVEYEYLR